MDFATASKVRTQLMARFKQLKKQRADAIERIAAKARQAMEESSAEHTDETAMVLQSYSEVRALAESLGAIGCATEDEVDVEVGE